MIQSTFLYIVLIDLFFIQMIYSSGIITIENFIEKNNNLTFDVYLINDSFNTIHGDAQNVLDLVREEKHEDIRAKITNTGRVIESMNKGCREHNRRNCQTDGLNKLHDIQLNTTMAISECFDFEQSQMNKELHSAKLSLEKRRTAIDEEREMCVAAEKENLFLNECHNVDFFNETAKALDRLHKMAINWKADIELLMNYRLGSIEPEVQNCMLPGMKNLELNLDNLKDGVEECLSLLVHNITQESATSRNRPMHMLNSC